MPAPLVSVVVPTRNRGAGIVGTVASILACDYPRFELLVVDQSADRLTEAALAPYGGDARLRYLRREGTGCTRARNAGIAAAAGELVAITDDDCVAAPDWLQELAAAFALDPRIGLVYGNVIPAPCDPRAGFVIGYRRTAPYLARSLRDKHRAEGISGNMGLRRSAWTRLAGFDEMLGAGAPLRSAGETDLTLRALAAGIHVYETPRPVVVHHGLRPWSDSLPQVRCYLYGIGAALAKNFRRDPVPVAGLLLRLGWRWALRPPVVDLGFRPPRGPRLAAFVEGFVAGARLPIDRATGHFAGGARAGVPGGEGHPGPRCDPST